VNGPVPPPIVDVLVAGVGPAGAAAATHLSSAGFRVVAVDRAAFPRDKPCSEYVSPGGVELLDRLGVLPDLVTAGAVAPPGMTVVGPRGSRLTGFFHARGSGHPAAGLSISRRLMDHRLLQTAQAAGVEVLERTAVEELVYEAGAVAGAVVRRPSGERQVIRARLTIGADGLRSLVARRVGRRRHGAPTRLAFVAHVTAVAGLTDTPEMHVGAAGYAGLNRIGPDLTNVALVVPAGRAAGARGRLTNYFFDRLDEFPGVRGRVRREDLAREVLVTGPFAAWSGRILVDGCLLVGDAAEFFDPFTGQGIYSALKGAELASGVAIAALQRPGIADRASLAPYAAARRRTMAGKWIIERAIGFGMCLPRAFDRTIAQLGSRSGAADTLISVTGDILPAGHLLHPRFLSRLVL
jgi:flavin-dependent dehydrogenase